MAASTAVAPRQGNPLVQIREQIDNREGEFKAALPAHIPVERFVRVLTTAVQNNPKLMTLERRSFFNAAMRAAQDGLLPDGREGAIVEFNGKATWMPMIGGIRKKARNSGEIVSWEAHVAFENDEFDYALGDEPYIKHKPALGDRGKPIAAYSVAVLKSGERSREVMSVGEIEKVRKVSRASGSGPWVQWWEEMARKTVARRHAKVLPMSSDLDDIIRRDDEMYAFGRPAQGGDPRMFAPVENPLVDQIEHHPAPDDEAAAPGAVEDPAPEADREGEGGVTDDGSDFPGDEALRAMERESGRGRRGAGRES